MSAPTQPSLDGVISAVEKLLPVGWDLALFREAVAPESGLFGRWMAMASGPERRFLRSHWVTVPTARHVDPEDAMDELGALLQARGGYRS